MWTAIWTLLAFVLLLCLLLFLGEPILAFAAEQLRERRAHRLSSSTNAPSKPRSRNRETR